ncbi:hypothetical protein Vretifemale_6259 [Volvox reticuliferus]|uniref:Uncharacterized protein n=2 Tax=Volvox reticuliferus TaxID=1737510 RepID=A0A8J4FHP9_9CHLO|nr:hypothetical protein Vretifemale_6259 [Volvox reticuliferus]
MSHLHHQARPATYRPGHSCGAILTTLPLAENLNVMHAFLAPAHRGPILTWGKAFPTARSAFGCHHHLLNPHVRSTPRHQRRPRTISATPEMDANRGNARSPFAKTMRPSASATGNTPPASDVRQGDSNHEEHPNDSNNKTAYASAVTAIAVSNGSTTPLAAMAAISTGSGNGFASSQMQVPAEVLVAASSMGSSPMGQFGAWFRRLVTEQYLPLMLLTALLAAVLKPSWGLAASRTSLQSGVTFAIFIIQGVMLRRGEAEKALHAKGAITWGLASILLLTPLVAPLAGALPLQPSGLALGLLVFACMPTTLSSGVALTQVLGGNTALALLLTISTNMTSVFTLPFVLPWALQASASLGGFSCSGGDGGVAVQLDPMPLLVQLVQCILVPTLIGAGVRGVLPGIRTWVDSNRRTLSVISGALLSLVPWMQVSKALAQGVVVAPGALAAAVGCSLGLHVVYLALNAAAAQVFRLGGSDPRVAAPTRRALVVVASQKTLPVAMAVLGRLGPVVGAEAAGCAAVTAVFSHLAQTCADFWLVSRWLEYIRRREAKHAMATTAATTTAAAAVAATSPPAPSAPPEPTAQSAAAIGISPPQPGAG